MLEQPLCIISLIPIQDPGDRAYPSYAVVYAGLLSLSQILSAGPAQPVAEYLRRYARGGIVV